MLRLVGSHAEILGGQMVEPGSEFDEARVDSAVLKRLKEQGKVRDVTPEPKSKKGGDA